MNENVENKYCRAPNLAEFVNICGKLIATDACIGAGAGAGSCSGPGDGFKQLAIFFA